MQRGELKSLLQQSALGLLSRREYSCYELRQRMLRTADKTGKGCDEGEEWQALVSELISVLLDELQQQGYQSDQRFAESLVRSRIGRGQGAIRIAQELRYKGVSDELRGQVMEACEQDWFELAFEVLQRRFGGCRLGDRREQAKRQRFLLYRGFTQEQCRYAFEQMAEYSDQN